MTVRRPTVAAPLILAACAALVACLAAAYGHRFRLLALGGLATAGVVVWLWIALERLAVRTTELRAALDASEDGLLVLDGQGRVVDHNRAFRRLWGVPDAVMASGDGSQVQAWMLTQLKDPEGFQARAGDLRAGLPTGGQDAPELWDGRIFERYLRPRPGDPDGLIWGFRDVTARGRADLFVQRLALAVEQSPATIVITDTAGSLQFVNAKFTQLTGYELDEALGRNLRMLKSGLTPARTYEELWSTITAGRVWVGELQNRKKDGSLFWERATISPLRDADGVITHYLGLKEDITLQKHLEMQLRHSQKFEVVGLLAGGVAHDLNNVLQVINGYGTLIQLGQAPGDPNRNGLAEILKAAERAGQLTQSLLAFSRKQVMNPRTLDLNAVVGNIEKLLRRIIGADIRLAVARAEAPLLVHVDLGQIEQVLLNLANNARDAMPRGGDLTIATAPFRLDQDFQDRHGFGRPGEFARLSVRDSGDGMDPEVLKRIFDPFFSTQELGRGTGLGLATVYGIVKQHDGYILVESEAGRGTLFELYLPIATSAPSATEAPELPESQVRGSETVLVVEDDPAVRGLVDLILKKYGYTVLLAVDGQDAVEAWHAHRSAIGLILMDVIMPRKSGRQAADEIRRADPAVKVLFISGYTADFIKNRGDLDLDMELLMKPVQPLVLLRKVREILDRRP